jgi:nitrate/nitrite transport system substrate-binding protein
MIRSKIGLFGLLARFKFAFYLTGVVFALAGGPHAPAMAAKMLEKDELTLGFIKLTDCVPLVVAKEKGFFEDEGLYVTLQAQANWKVLMDRVIDGQLDGSHMLAAAPMGHSDGLLTKADIVVPYVMSLNGAGISVSNEVWAKMKQSISMEDGKPVHPIKADALRPFIEEYKNQGKAVKMSMTYPVGTHNYIFRYWLAAGGIHPGFYTASDTSGMTDAEVQLSVTPPPQMPAVLEAGTSQGVCVNDPWHKQIVEKGVGVPVTSSLFINTGISDKVFGVTQKWAQENPNTLNAIVKALIRAGKWLDEDVKNRDEAAKILSKPEYVGANYEVIKQMMIGKFEYEKGDIRSEPDWDVFFRNYATYPYYSDAIWWLTQVRRWGQVGPKTEEWYFELSKKVYHPEIWMTAAQELVKEGKLAESDIPQTDGFKEPSTKFIDDVTFDGRKPLEYLKQLKIGHKD